MAKKIVAYLGEIEERHGEVEFSNTVLLEDNTDDYLKQYTKEWYGSDDDDFDEDDGGFWLTTGGMVFLAGVHRGLTQEEVDLYHQAEQLKHIYMGKI